MSSQKYKKVNIAFNFELPFFFFFIWFRIHYSEAMACLVSLESVHYFDEISVYPGRVGSLIFIEWASARREVINRNGSAMTMYYSARLAVDPLCDGALACRPIRCINDIALMDQGHCLVGLILQGPSSRVHKWSPCKFTNAVCECESRYRLSDKRYDICKASINYENSRSSPCSLLSCVNN